MSISEAVQLVINASYMNKKNLGIYALNMGKQIFIYEIAKRIAQAGHDFILQFLKMSDIEEYWIQLISKYAAKLTFQPKTHDAMIPVKQTKRH